ncbi:MULTISPECIES: TetR/AcrR family transcriptional regulator [Streptomyces]|uniref:TetR/AcrR family transcriptional regulator n=1 Tax=Streptomyces TaxID=1883 RepID=UPI0002D87C7D|nr:MULTISPECIES: TetR/AcrR family transcriptional regulator [unclassified Streptomyces]QGZ47435.1 TetR family transcriptional regulator [Streptomyces sp. QHH-9511]
MAHVPAAERRPQLINAAITLMAREGIAAGSTRAIAAELGVAQTTVHYTFGTKEDLYRAVMEQLTSNLVAQVEGAAPEGAGFEETIAALAVALWRTVEEDASGYRLLTELAMHALRTPGLGEARAAYYRQVNEVTERIVTEAASRTGFVLAQPADLLARFFLSGFDGLTMQRLYMPDKPTVEVDLGALVAATLALADGRLDPTPR